MGMKKLRNPIVAVLMVLTLAAVAIAQDPIRQFSSFEIHRGWLWLGTNVNMYMEGATVDDYQTILAPADPTADRTWTFPDNTGTVGKTLLGPLTWTSTSIGDANYSVVSGDVMIVYTSLGATAARTVVLPSATDNQNRIIVVRDATGLTAGNATILTSGTINLAIGTSNTWAISTPFGSMRFHAGYAAPNGVRSYSWFANAW